MTYRLLTALLGATLVCACSFGGPVTSDTNGSHTQLVIGKSGGGADGSAASPPSPPSALATGLDVFLPFTLQVTLSNPARDYLRDNKETIIFYAAYYAYPIASATAQANAVGQIDLGKWQLPLSGAGTVTFDSSGFLAKRLPLIKGHPQVNVNVASARKSGPDNVLKCDFFEAPLAVAAHRPHRLHCSLITEGLDTRHVPGGS